VNKNWLRSKYVVFGFIFLMMANVLNHNERFVIHSNDPMWNHYQSFKWWLLPHVLVGACALFLGPMQFSDRLRLRYTKLHRVVGRVYVAGVLIAAPQIVAPNYALGSGWNAPITIKNGNPGIGILITAVNATKTSLQFLSKIKEGLG
jgi:hypothetical protein